MPAYRRGEQFVAVVLFVLWLLFHAAGALVNLTWPPIIVLVVIWLIGLTVHRPVEPVGIDHVQRLRKVLVED